MTYHVRLRSTSASSASGDPIPLRETKTTRLVFCPIVVRNLTNPEASVKGVLVHQRRANEEQPWEDVDTVTLSQLHAGEAAKFSFSTGETTRLIDGLTAYAAAFRQHGIESGEQEYEVEAVALSDLVQLLAGNEAATELLSADGGPEAVAKLIACAAELNIVETLQMALDALGLEALSYLNTALRLAELKEASRLWEENKDSSDEEFWQRELKIRPWILSQVFSQPMLMIGDKVYVGGKDITNTGGKIADYLFKNSLTSNVAIVEIKAPTAELVSGTEYRQGVYTPGKDIAGGSVQVLDQRDSLVKHYNELSRGPNTQFEAHMPVCVLVAGRFDTLNDNQRKSFELNRSNSKDVEIVTFDELFARVRAMVDLFEVAEHQE